MRAKAKGVAGDCIGCHSYNKGCVRGAEVRIDGTGGGLSPKPWRRHRAIRAQWGKADIGAQKASAG